MRSICAPTEVHSHHRPFLRSRFRDHPSRCFSALEEQRDTNRRLHTHETSPLNAANALTLIRMVAAPVVGGLILNEEHTLALATIAVAGVTDAVDGWLARRYGLQTTLGSYMDPLADKLLVACATGALAVHGVLPLWLVAVVVIRDTGLVLGVAVRPKTRHAVALWRKGKLKLPPLVMQPLPSSKINTVLQILLTVAGTAYAGEYSLVSQDMIQYLCTATAVTTTYTATRYGYMQIARSWSTKS